MFFRTLRILTALFVIVVGCSTAHAGLSWTRTAQRLTVPAYQDPAVITFHCRNTGKTAVTAAMVQSGCACAKAALVPSTVPPGGMAVLRITYDLKKSIGYIKKTARLTMKSGAVHRLTFILDVEGPLELSTTKLYWRVGEPAIGKTIPLQLKQGIKWRKPVELKNRNALGFDAEIVKDDNGNSLVRVTPKSTEQKTSGSCTLEALAVQGDKPITKVYTIRYRVK